MSKNLKNAKELESLTAYEIIKTEELNDLNSLGIVLRHKKSGARLAVISNDDNNKVFSIGFRTPPTNSTGVAHIIEHTVLCGSEQFPVKDPFIELAKGSLNTFLNAMTYPDKTVYPIASCNDKDFQNLMHVYMDAVFYPNIYKRQEIFMQEGWHYELEEEDGELIYNGVVYNEMKGAFSSPESILARQIQKSLYPDTSYSVESGGDPDNIPDLTYEEYLAFHKKYYHPSNSYIYLYGDMDVQEKLEWLDSAYLSRFEASHVDSVIKTQPAFEEVHLEEKFYPIAEGEEEKDKTYLSYAFSIGDSLDQETVLAFTILEQVLLSAPGAPLKQALLNAGIGNDVLSDFTGEIKQPMFSVMVKNSEASKLDDFVHIVKQTLREQVIKGVDEKSLRAALNVAEFQYREADFGQFPKGLMYGLQMMATWLYNDDCVFTTLHENDIFKTLKEKIGTGYYEDLIQKYILDNPHASILILKPEAGLTTKKEEALKKKLAEYKKSLTKEEVQGIIARTKALRQYQEEPSTQEELKCIPMLKREDIEKKAPALFIKEQQIDGIKVLHHDIFTNGIVYLKLLFELKNYPKELTNYLGLLNAVLGYIDTEDKSFLEFSNDVNIATGGMSSSVYTYGQRGDSKNYKRELGIDVRVLHDNVGTAFELIKEMLTKSKLEDTDRIQEIVLEAKSRLQMRFMSNGHTAAVDRTISYYSEEAYFENETKGIGYYQFLEDLCENFEEKKEEIVASLKTLMKYIFRKENLLISITANEEGYNKAIGQIESFVSCLQDEPVENHEWKFEPVKRNEGFKTSAQVQYVACAGNFFDAGLKYTGALRVLKTIMGYDYLWNNIRVKGGAYGCMCNFSGIDGNGYFVSYRDPNLKATMEVYESVADYVANFEADERELTKFVIGTMSSLDTPLNPLSKGSRSLSAYMSGTTMEDIQKDRDQILNVTVEDIRALSPIMKAIVDAGYHCVIGNGNKIMQDAKLFDEIKDLNR